MGSNDQNLDRIFDVDENGENEYERSVDFVNVAERNNRNGLAQKSSETDKLSVNGVNLPLQSVHTQSMDRDHIRIGNQSFQILDQWPYTTTYMSSGFTHNSPVLSNGAESVVRTEPHSVRFLEYNDRATQNETVMNSGIQNTRTASSDFSFLPSNVYSSNEHRAVGTVYQRTNQYDDWLANRSYASSTSAVILPR